MSNAGHEKLTMLQRSFEEAHPGHRLIMVLPTMLGTTRYGLSKDTPYSHTSLHLLSMPLYSKHHRRNLYLFHAVEHRPSPDPLSIHFCTDFTHTSSPASSVHAFVAKTRRPAQFSRYVLIELNPIGVTGPYFRGVALTTLRPQARYSSSTPPRPKKHSHLTHRQTLACCALPKSQYCQCCY